MDVLARRVQAGKEQKCPSMPLHRLLADNLAHIKFMSFHLAILMNIAYFIEFSCFQSLLFWLFMLFIILLVSLYPAPK